MSIQSRWSTWSYTQAELAVQNLEAPYPFDFIRLGRVEEGPARKWGALPVEVHYHGLMELSREEVLRLRERIAAVDPLLVEAAGEVDSTLLEWARSLSPPGAALCRQPGLCRIPEVPA
jgi:hypothetical protein